jgi:Carboxypeptidase regulatory-like domain
MICGARQITLVFSGDLMTFGGVQRIARIALILLAAPLALVLGSPGTFAQTASGTLRGQVTDPSGSVISNATVIVTTATGNALTAVTNRDGIYEFKSLIPGKYGVKVIAQGFAPFETSNVEVLAGQIRKLDVPLTIEVREEKVTVTDQAATALDTNPANNAGAIVLQGKDLEALSDDPDDLQSDLQALAGPSAGPNGGQIYIDGFTGGQLPPKASIREIRINQNPFSAEYDKLGYGRIEILTKPGSDQFHGQLYFSATSSAFNSKSPFVRTQPGYETTQFSGNVGGPLSKKASFFFNLERRDINDSQVIDARTLDSNFNPLTLSEAVANPRTRTNFSPRLDYQLGANNTLTARYQFYRENETNNGVGQFSLPSQAYNVTNTEQTLQVSDSQIFGAKIVNETRFQYMRDRNNLNAQSTLPTIGVPGAFTGGGNGQGSIIDNQDHYELQNYTSMVLSTHFLKFGGRVRDIRDSSNSMSNFNGTYTFTSLDGPELTSYKSTLMNLPGSGPNQARVTQGLPSLAVNVFDVGVYLQDDWRFRSNMTLSYGLRYETQNAINDHADVAPRIGFAWGLGGGGKNKSPKTVLRAGFGMFYDRFTSDLVMQAERVNGLNQEQLVINNPAYCPNSPGLTCLNLPAQPCATGSSLIDPNTCSKYRIDPNLRAPYVMQTGVSLERQLTKSANLTITYLNSRGVHSLLVSNINAPEPGTYPPGDPFNAAAIRPFGNVGNIFEYQSDGVFRQKQLIVNSNIRAGTKVSLFGFYMLNYADSDTAGPSSFSSNPYALGQDYGRAAFDIRHRVVVGGTIAFPHAFRLSPFLIAQSGPPFNITVPTDLNGTTVFNSRPSFASNLSNPADVLITQFGTFDTVPVPGEKIVPINYGNTSPRFTLNVRLGKTFGFGRKPETAPTAGGPGGGPGGGRGGGGEHGRGGPFGGGFGGMGTPTDRRYNLTFSVSARNVLNVVNVATPSGVLGSPFFGQPNALATGPFSSAGANRRIDLQVQFAF